MSGSEIERLSKGRARQRAAETQRHRGTEREWRVQANERPHETTNPRAARQRKSYKQTIKTKNKEKKQEKRNSNTVDRVVADGAPSSTGRGTRLPRLWIYVTFLLRLESVCSVRVCVRARVLVLFSCANDTVEEVRWRLAGARSRTVVVGDVAAVADR